MRPALRIVRRGRVTSLEGFAPTETLLEHLRLREGATGTKEGCAEGDCGACTVAVGRLRDGRVVYEPTNSCIQLLGSLDGAEVVTVDDLASSATDLHPVQQALVDHHASQCGFCTPGFVMTLFALYHANEQPDRAAVNEWLAGNLCRCTGYRPIADAALASCGGAPRDEFTQNAGRTAEQLAALDDGQDLFVGNDETFFAAPASEDSLADLCARHPEAVITGGATDVGLWITKELRDLPRIIHTGRVSSLRAVSEERDRVELGAAATYAEAESALSGIDPDVGEVLQRLGSKQVRALGTVGGNIANGSPIGDMPPVLIALGASIELRLGERRRTLPLEEFFLDYGLQDREPGEVLTRIRVPRLGRDERFRSYKISKRYDQDISSVLGAFWFHTVGGRIVAARMAWGGMAATPRRSPRTEEVVIGLSLDDQGPSPDAEEALRAALARDFSPIDDHRASARYRQRVAGALVLKALREIAGRPSGETRVRGHRQDAA